MKPLKTATLATAILLFLFPSGCSGRRPTSMGITDGSLAPCPSSPNCVSSMVQDKKHRIEPLAYVPDKQQAFNALLQLLSAQKRTTIVKQTDNYLHVEFKSKIFRFVDDVEFYFPEDEKMIHVRSASRLGYSDLGVNRKRVELIRRQLEKNMASGARKK